MSIIMTSTNSTITIKKNNTTSYTRQDNKFKIADGNKNNIIKGESI